MRTVVLFIAMSLDGYIADHNGNVDWLSGQNEAGETSDTYSSFVKEADTVIMGWNTYDQIVRELSPSVWPYPDLTSYVITHKKAVSTDPLIFSCENPGEIVTRLKRKPGKDIWICGGANIAQQLMRENLIDTYHISVIPTLLGTGIRLFDSTNRPLPLQLVHTQHYNGIVDLVYTRR